MRRAAEEVQAGGNTPAAIVSHRSDARELPFDDGVLDAVYVVTALGEIPEPARVLGAAARVLKPGGRLVVGEFFDRHWIPFGRLHRLAEAGNLPVSDVDMGTESVHICGKGAKTGRSGSARRRLARCPGICGRGTDTRAGSCRTCGWPTEAVHP